MSWLLLSPEPMSWGVGGGVPQARQADLDYPADLWPHLMLKFNSHQKGEVLLSVNSNPVGSHPQEEFFKNSRSEAHRKFLSQDHVDRKQRSPGRGVRGVLPGRTPGPHQGAAPGQQHREATSFRQQTRGSLPPGWGHTGGCSGLPPGGAQGMVPAVITLSARHARPALSLLRHLSGFAPTRNACSEEPEARGLPAPLPR